MHVVAVIPARSGSKTVPHKNIKELSGRPLLAFSIAAARKSKLINRTIVSTDSETYADVARRYLRKVPFLGNPVPRSIQSHLVKVCWPVVTFVI